MDLIYNNTNTLPIQPPTSNPFQRRPLPFHPSTSILLNTPNTKHTQILTAKIFRQMVRGKFHFIFRLICGYNCMYFVYFLCYYVTVTGGRCPGKPIRFPYKTSGGTFYLCVSNTLDGRTYG